MTADVRADRAVAVIGEFDRFHLGHQTLVNEAHASPTRWR